MNHFERIMARMKRTSKGRDASDRVEQILRQAAPIYAGVDTVVERAGNKKAPNGESYHVHIKASTGNVARDAGIIPITAWENGGLANFVRNPMILAYHKHDSPIGISVHTSIDGDALAQYWLFHEETDLSRTMKKLYERGFMRAASVGFSVKEYEFVDEEEETQLQESLGIDDPIWWRAIDAELLETSAVPVPADPYALVIDHAMKNGRACGIDVRAITERKTSNGERSMKNNNDKSEGQEPTTPPESQESKDERSTEDRLAALEDSIGEIRDMLKAALPKTDSKEGGERAESENGKTESSKDDGDSTSEKNDADTRSQEDDEKDEETRSVVKIAVQDGETEEEAISRLVDSLVDKARGAPAAQ